MKSIKEKPMAMIKIKKRHLVPPCKETWNGILPLSQLDQVGVITHSSHIHLYERPIDEEWLNPTENKIIKTLKESLSLALVSFYPLAGRLRSLCEGRFELECNAMGAELIDASCDMNLSDLGNLLSSNKKIRNLLPKMDYHHLHGTPINDIPVLVVQVTQFQCGGLSFGMSVSHLVVDGRSAFYFTEEWARLARGEQLKIKPFHDRKVLDGDVLARPPAYDGKSGNYFSDLYFGRVEKIEWENKATPTTVILRKDKIEKLKKAANSNTEGVHGRPYSRFEVITAYMWICLTKARELNTEEITSLACCVDVRGRLNPPLPSSYFGNAIVDVIATSRVGELLCRPLSYACSKVRKALDEVNDEYVSSAISYYKNKKSLAKYQMFDDRGNMKCPSPSSSSSSANDHSAFVLSWLNLSDSEINFGWGNCVYTGPCLVRGSDGDIMLFPSDSVGSVTVTVCLPSKGKFLRCVNSPILI